MTTPPDYAWTDQTYLLFKNHVSWKCYVQSGTEPDCADDAADCPPVNQNGKTPSIWNPLPSFDTVKEDRQLPNITDVTNFYRDAKAGTLPAVSWITPSGPNSEHPPALLSDGQAWTTSLINAAMQGPEWDSAVIFLSWDDWGGFYDHVQAYVKFIEDDFLGGQRIDPSTDGRPDPRPDVRENAPQLGNLALDFDFSQPPRPPLVLPVHPAPGLAIHRHAQRVISSNPPWIEKGDVSSPAPPHCGRIRADQRTGTSTITSKPPSGSARAIAAPPCAVAMARTIDNPKPAP